MLAPDLDPIILAFLGVIAYNAIMTCIFMNQRFRLGLKPLVPRLGAWFATFGASVVFQLFLDLLPGNMQIWPFAYAVVITLLVFIERLMRTRKRSKNGLSN